MWAVVQAARSEIHFGYMEYAVQRLAQYYKYKTCLTQRFGALSRERTPSTHTQCST